MKFNIVTIFPEMILSGIQQGVLAQGLKKDLIEVEVHQLRDYSLEKHRHIDDRPFGGGDGMIMKAEPLYDCLEKIKSTDDQDTYVIYLSPQGDVLNETKVRQLAQKKNITLICGRYGGVDQRFITECVNEELSIGDYVLSGGELGALVIVDAVARKIPGVLGHDESSEKDSFASGLLEEAQFTKPRDWRGMSTPEILLSGDHQRIAIYKLKVSLLTTALKRADLFLQNGAEIMQKNKIKAKDLVLFFQTLTLEEKVSLGFLKHNSQDQLEQIDQSLLIQIQTLLKRMGDQK